MPTDDGDPVVHAQTLEEAVDQALAGFPGEERADALEAVDFRWLGIGVRLGLERPDEARHLLGLIEAREADPAALREDDTGGVVRRAPPATGATGDAASIPVSSALLARAAALQPSERARIGPEAVFGWAARLAPGEILRLGGAVREMLAAGSPADIGKGFGLAWSAGVRLPRKDLTPLFGEFTELELTVAGVLAGRDLRASEPVPQAQGIGALLGQFGLRTRPGASQADAALDRSGEPGRLGLIALWNAWMAMRFRPLIPRPTFDLLVHPWVTVVGPLPEQ